MEDRVKAIMADVFMIDASAIGPDASVNTIDQWDSLAQINLIAALEEEFGVQFDVEEFERMTSFTELLEALSGKL